MFFFCMTQLTATRRVSSTETSRQTIPVYTEIRPGAVSGRSVSPQFVGDYQYTETLGYGDGQLCADA